MSDKLPPKILIVEPDMIFNISLSNSIERYGFDVVKAADADAALRSAVVNVPNIAILSSQISDRSLVDMASQLRDIQGLEKLPLLCLVNQDEYEKLKSELPGNEFLVKPISIDDLMTSIKKLIRESKPVLRERVLVYNDIRMDLSTYKVYRDNKQVHLGPTEFKILQLLIQKPTTVYSRSQIIDYVWGIDKNIEIRTVDVHINRIRKLITLETDRYQVIKTIRSAGYSLD